MASLEKYIASVDIGTTTLRCCLYTKKGRLAAVAQTPVKLLYPGPSRCEIDPNVLWADFVATVNKTISNCGCTPRQIVAMGVCSQRNTFITWDRDTGVPLHNFLTWQDLSAERYTDQWNKSWTLKVVVRLVSSCEIDFG